MSRRCTMSLLFARTLRHCRSEGSGARRAVTNWRTSPLLATEVGTSMRMRGVLRQSQPPAACA